MRVTLPDGKALELADGASGADAAAAIGPGLARAALAIVVDGVVLVLAAPLPANAKISIITKKSNESLELIRHDCAHVLATAVLSLYPGTKIAIGPAIADGFYYDFDFPDGTTISDADLPAIEEKMREVIAEAEPFERTDISVDEALKRFKGEHEDYKVELIEDLVKNEGVKTVSLYRNGPFTDLCRGPHGPNTGDIGAFKLQSLAGAYWRGDSDRPMLTRIYGTAFHSKKELAEYLELLEEAKARDHRKLGKQLELFMLSDTSPGAPFWLPNGMALWNAVTEFWREQNLRRGYKEVRTPIIFDLELWKQSGHWDKYRENMYVTKSEERVMGVKPMNCPGHVKLYEDKRRSYRDLPIRYSEAGIVHRDELSGTLHGLLRVRHITQDDAHIFCTEDQIQDEILACLDFAFYLYEVFGFEPRLELSTRPENRIGTDEMWDHAEGALESALRKKGLEFELNPGDGAFYGPKIDLHMTDSIGRGWQLGTIQLDYSMPERFGITYTGADNAEHRPVMIHRAVMGAFERFIGILIEHYAGEFPIWLAPIQAILLPLSDRHNPYAREVVIALRAAGLRVEVDERSESTGRKIRDAEQRKIPYMLVVGDREEEQRTVSVRRHRVGDLGVQTLGEITERLREEMVTRKDLPIGSELRT
jgi:threonyl-tRNA synthetase